MHKNQTRPLPDFGLWVLAMMQRSDKICPECGFPMRAHFPITFDTQGVACGVSRQRMNQVYEKTMRKIRGMFYRSGIPESALREYFLHAK